MKKSMKTVSIFIALLTAIAMFGFLSCDNSDSGGGSSTAKSDVASLLTISIGSIDVTATGFGDPDYAAAADDVQDVDLPHAFSSTAQEITVEGTNEKSTVKFAYVAEEDFSATAAPVFGAANSFTFVDGDYLIVESTSEDGKKKMYYVMKLLVGNSADIDVFSFNTVSLPRGTPAAGTDEDPADYEDAVAGVFQFTSTKSETTTVTIVADALDPDAAVTFAVASGTAVPSFSASKPASINDGDFLYVQVISQNGKVEKIYKTQINYRQEVTLNLVQSLYDFDWSVSDPIAAFLSEDLSDFVDVNVDRWASESGYKTGSPRDAGDKMTYGEAKVAWDEDGVFVYVKVYDDEITSGTGGEAHERDSVEVFINEAGIFSTSHLYSTASSQYRVGADGKLSGHGNSTGVFTTTYAKAKAKTSTGYYEVLLQAPWRFKDEYPLAERTCIGLELQINASDATGGRWGVVAWNNFAFGGTNYENPNGFGKAILDLNGNTLRVDAKKPSISVQPVSAVYTSGAASLTALTVTAALPADQASTGSLVYQWYMGSSIGDTAATAVGTNSATLNIESIADGSAGNWDPETYYFWVEVSNQLSVGIPPYNKASVTSNAAQVKIWPDDFDVEAQTSPIERIELNNAAFAIYRFDLPPGWKWSDFDKLTVDYYTTQNQLTIANLRAARLMGNYKASDFEEKTGKMVAVYDAKNAPYIMDNSHNLTSLTLTADDWTTVTYAIDGSKGHSSFNADNVPDANDTGPFYFGIGLSRGFGGDAAWLQWVKNVTLTNEAGDKYIISQGSGFALPAFAANADSSLPNQKRSIVDASDVGDEPEPEAEPYDFTEGLPVKNTTAMTGTYSGNGPVVDLTADEDFDIADGYTSIIVGLKVFDGDNDEITGVNIGWDTIQIKFWDAVPSNSNPNDMTELATTYNFANGIQSGGTVTLALPAAVKEADVLAAISIQSAGRDQASSLEVHYVEITSIRFE